MRIGRLVHAPQRPAAVGSGREGYLYAAHLLAAKGGEGDGLTGLEFAKPRLECGRGETPAFDRDDFIAREGDPHYQSIRRDGTSYRALRDYAEAGLTRLFPLAPQSWIEASARWHRVENDYEYSFRIVAVARLTVK